MLFRSLTAPWDQDVPVESGVNELAIFRLESQTFAASLERSTFREARISTTTVEARHGNVWLKFEPYVRLGPDD